MILANTKTKIFAVATENHSKTLIAKNACEYLKKIPTFEEIVKMSDEKVKNITTEEWIQIYGHENRTEEEKKEITTMIELLKCFPPYIIKATLARKIMEDKSGTNADRDDDREKRHTEGR